MYQGGKCEEQMSITEPVDFVHCLCIMKMWWHLEGFLSKKSCLINYSILEIVFKNTHCDSRQYLVA